MDDQEITLDFYTLEGSATEEEADPDGVRQTLRPYFAVSIEGLDREQQEKIGDILSDMEPVVTGHPFYMNVGRVLRREGGDASAKLPCVSFARVDDMRMFIGNLESEGVIPYQPSVHFEMQRQAEEYVKQLHPEMSR